MVSEYERMEQFAYECDILLLTGKLPCNLAGHCYLNSEFGIKSIILNASLDTSAKRTCVLAEELEHYLSTPGDLFNAPPCIQDKYERIARLGAAKKLIPFDKLIRARSADVDNIYDLAGYLNVSPDFLIMSLNLYKEQYGLSVTYRGYIIYFDPLNIEKAS